MSLLVFLGLHQGDGSWIWGWGKSLSHPPLLNSLLVSPVLLKFSRSLLLLDMWKVFIVNTVKQMLKNGGKISVI